MTHKLKYEAPTRFDKRDFDGTSIAIGHEAPSRILDLLEGLVVTNAYQRVTMVQPGASPFVIVFADIGLKNMANTQYEIFLGGDHSAKPLLSSYTTTGLSLIGGSIGDTIHMLVLGTIVQ